MLGSLAIKLRILGFDTIYDKTSSDAELLDSTALSSRNLLTSDVDLFLLAKRRHLKATLISSRDEVGRVIELYSKLGMRKAIVPRVSRCSACNGTLKRAKDRTSLEKYRIPARVVVRRIGKARIGRNSMLFLMKRILD